MGAAWSFDSELFETVVLEADVVLDCGGTEMLVVSKQCRIWWML